MKSLDDIFIALRGSLDHSCDRIAKPLLEFPVAGEDMGHQEVHQGPEFHQIVLERGAGEQQAPITLEIQQQLPSLGLEVFDVMSLVKNEVLPLFPPEALVVLNN